MLQLSRTPNGSYAHGSFCMAPPPRAPVRNKRRSLAEKGFLDKVQSSDGFVRALGTLEARTGVEVNELQSFAVELCKACWSEAGQAMSVEDSVKAALTEVDRLKQKLNQCNLAAMKQMAADKMSAHSQGAYEQDTIIFYEPMQFMDEAAKDLVLTVANDKVRLLEAGHAPPSLVEALMRNANAKYEPAEAVDAAELKEARMELEDAKLELRKTKLRLQDADREAGEWRGKLAASEERNKVLQQVLDTTKDLLTAAETRATEAERALEEVQAREAALRKAHEELQLRCAKQQAEIERQQGEIKRQQAEINRQAAKIEQQREQLERLGAELELEKQANAKLRADVTRLEAELVHEREVNAELRAEIARLQVFVARAEQLERELNALQQRFDKLEAEADVMRKELARRNNTRTCGTQTSLTGPKLEEQSAENKRLKVMIQELQEKFQELMEKCRRKGIGKEVAQIAKDLGLEEVLKEQTVFQRLYDDALHRVHRLEKLRDKVKKEQARGWPAGEAHSPRTMASVASPEVPVMQALEQSDLAAVRRLAQEREMPVHSPQPVMRSSSSLPVLPVANPQSVSVVNFNLAGWQRNVRMRHP